MAPLGIKRPKCAVSYVKMLRFLRVLCGASVLLPALAGAVVTAYDDAADPVYNSLGNYHGLNGGFGFGAWTTNSLGNPGVTVFVGSSFGNGGAGPNIDTGGRAWGNWAVPNPSTNTFQARRSLLTDLPVLGTYSVDMDTGSIDGREAVSFGAGSNTIGDFFLTDTSGTYQYKDTLSGVVFNTGITQTFNGLRLTLTRTTASSYAFQAVRLSDSLTYVFNGAYDTTAIPGIRTITVTNNASGNGMGHAMFVNRMVATAVPEPATLTAIGIGFVLLLRRRKA